VELVALANCLEDPAFPLFGLQLPPRTNQVPAKSPPRGNFFMLKLGVNIDHVATLREAGIAGVEKANPTRSKRR
jgi:hypothetical protein